MAPRLRPSRERPTLLISVSQELVPGIIAYMPRHGPWEPLSCQPWELSFVTTNSMGLPLAGIIYHQVDPAGFRPRLPPGVPTVLIDQAPANNLLCVSSDGLAIGDLAYRSLRALGFRRFGFWGVPGYWTSDQRQLGFQAGVARSGLTLHPGTRPGLGTYAEVMVAAMAWLRAAPKPIAVFTDNSQRACEMRWAARLAGLQVPDQVAILSGAEDRLLCTLNRPEISAIEVHAEELGRSAAALLDEARGSRPPRHRSLLVAPRQMIARRSTETLAEVSAPVAQALAFISARCATGIGVEAVVRASGMSRRSLELAFRADLDRTIGDELGLARVARARELLESTRLGLDDISARVGVGGSSQLCRLVTRHLGMGPRAYRQRYGLPGRARARRIVPLGGSRP
jgi:LacI family transcriptional regulator